MPSWFTIVAGILLAGCLFETRVASTEILDPPGKGTVTGIIYDASGRPSPGTWVRAFPVGFDPVMDPRRDSIARHQDTTDSTGAFSIKGLDSGSYNLFAVRSSDGTRLLIRDVHIGRFTRIASDGNRLQAPGALSVNLHDTLGHDGAYIYIPGTPLYAFVDPEPGETPTVLIDLVPTGIAPGVSYAAPARNAPPVPLAGEVMVQPLDTVPAGAYPGWKHRRRIFVNTAGTSGAPRIREKVIGFPLLVRLSADNFDFAEAREDGRDIRFTRPGGTPLPYEIEFWDVRAARAAVWVRLDTVRGDDAGQFLRMYWGNRSADIASQSYGPGVFRIGDGYRGVWHLAENPDSGSYRDATAQGNHGEGVGFSGQSRIETPIGRGQVFRGRETHIQAAPSASLHTDTNLTLEAWIRFDVYQEYANFISRAYTADVRPTYEYGLSLGNEMNNFRFAISNTDSAYQDLFSTHTASPGRWYHVAATYDGNWMRMFIDGAPTDSLPFQGRLNAFGNPLMIGKYQHRQEYSVLGTLDEIRMSNVTRSAAYMRLAHEAQRSGSRLLRFE